MSNEFKTNFISETIEHPVFPDTPAMNFFSKWCKVHDSITPHFIPRWRWQKRGAQGMLEKDNQGKQTLFLPKDLHLWEVMDVIKTVDYDTFARTPEKRGKRSETIKELGKTFEKAGLYLQEYLPTLDKNAGKEIAEVIAQEFYQYGMALQNQERDDAVPQAEISKIELSPEDKQKFDEWFLGKDIHQKRMGRLGENHTQENIEEKRKQILGNYFKALAKEGYKAEGEKPWEIVKGPAQHLQDTTKKHIIREIETPKRETGTAIFRRGMEKLVTEMKEVGWRGDIDNSLKELGLDPLLEQKKLYDILRIDQLKTELKEVKETGDIEKISAKELEIAKKIQKAVTRFPYKERNNDPSKMIETQFMNCVGSSILGGGLLDELGIKYLHANLPRHSATVLITSDGKAYWQDFTNGWMPEDFTEITPDMLEEHTQISEFANHSNNPKVSITFKKWNPYSHIKGKLKVSLSNPEIGLQCSILNNVGSVLNNLNANEEVTKGRDKKAIKIQEAIKAFQQAISIDPKDNISYVRMGDALEALGRNEEAVEKFQHAIRIDPEYHPAYTLLGNVLIKLDRKEEAIKVLRQAINIDPKNNLPHVLIARILSSLGRNEEAVEEFQHAISVDSENVLLHRELGDALRALGKNEEAVEEFQHAISVDSENVLLHRELGDALRALGRNEEAIKEYKGLISLWKEDKSLVRRAQVKRAQRIIEELEKE